MAFFVKNQQGLLVLPSVGLVIHKGAIQGKIPTANAVTSFFMKNLSPSKLGQIFHKKTRFLNRDFSL